ncbi:hypothetical protein D3C72_2363440 [compost metagenome]
MGGMALTASWPAPWYTDSMIFFLSTAMSSACRTFSWAMGLASLLPLILSITL